MDRKRIKAEAKEKIKGHLWDVWKPQLLLIFISIIIALLVETIFGPTATVKYNENAKTFSELIQSMEVETNNLATIVSDLFNILLIPLNIGTPISDIGIEAKSAIMIEITSSNV